MGIGPGLLHPFPNQDGSLVKGGLSIDISPLTMDGGLVVGLVDLMFGYFVCIYLSKKPFFLVGDF